MAERRCALCGQPLPETLTQVEIDSRLRRLSTPALAEERKRLQEEFEHQLVHEREHALKACPKQSAARHSCGQRAGQKSRSGSC